MVFYEDRPFTREDFKDFMFAQSSRKPEMLKPGEQGLKAKYDLKVARSATKVGSSPVYRIKKFNLSTFIDFFMSSCFVHFRKPDDDLYRMALDIAQADAGQVVYIDDRALFVEIAQSLGLHGIQHTDLEVTRQTLKDLGLALEGIAGSSQPVACSQE